VPILKSVKFKTLLSPRCADFKFKGDSDLGKEFPLLGDVKKLSIF